MLSLRYLKIISSIPPSRKDWKRCLKTTKIGRLTFSTIPDTINKILHGFYQFKTTNNNNYTIIIWNIAVPAYYIRQ